MAHPLVIAVFGPSPKREKQVPTDVLDAAERFGREIATQGHIVLTGGELKDGTDGYHSVKDCAIAGAEQAAGDSQNIVWIGVANTPEPRMPRRSGSRCGLVLYPGFTHSRNYVEAEVCDAAIALPGGAGTGSEVGFCLARGRPVILVGAAWERNYDLSPDRRGALLAAFRRDVADRVQSVQPQAPWIDEINEASKRLSPTNLELPLEYFPLPNLDGVGEVVQRVMSLVGR